MYVERDAPLSGHCMRKTHDERPTSKQKFALESGMVELFVHTCVVLIKMLALLNGCVCGAEKHPESSHCISERDSESSGLCSGASSPLLTVISTSVHKSDGKFDGEYATTEPNAEQSYRISPFNSV
jgi:hypothetical protein